MLDVTPNFNFEKLRNRLPIFKNDISKAILSLQREDYLSLKIEISKWGEEEFAQVRKTIYCLINRNVSIDKIHEALKFDIKLAYDVYFNGDKSNVAISLYEKLEKIK